MGNLHLFLDMDGCITAFDQAVKNLNPDLVKGLGDNASPEDEQAMCKAVDKAGESFWSEMGWAPGGRELWNIFKPYHPTLLTSTKNFSGAKSGKILWVKRNIPGTPIFFSDSKSEYVNPYETSVLVDDNRYNIKAWEDHGGIGILHQSVENTERQFLELLWNEPPEINPSNKYW